MTSILIILVAGASYGSDRQEIVPPLGNSLFSELAKFNSDGWGKISSEIEATFESDFERGMKILSEQDPHLLPPLQRAMAKYFFNFIPQDTNLYKIIAKKIKCNNLKISFVTLNYERLLELSLLQEEIQPIVGSEAQNNNQVEICFPHGCCHIFCEAAKGNASNTSFAGMNVQTNGEIKIISDISKFQQRINNDAFPPVMSYFEPTKYTTSGGNFIQDQRTRFKILVEKANKIVIIGLRVREHDKHIWDLLQTTKARIIYCSGLSAAKEYQKWSQDYSRDGDIILKEYFNENSLSRILSLITD